jgi:hypothetical protein
MLFAYPELAYTKDSMTVDLHWRPAHHPDLFPPSETLITEAQTVSIGAITFPTLNTTHALWLEALKMLQDRNFSLSISTSLALLAERTEKETNNHQYLPPSLMVTAQAFASTLLGLPASGSLVPALLGDNCRMQLLHRNNWQLYSSMGTKFPSHLRWDSLPSQLELKSRKNTLIMTGRRVIAFRVLLTQRIARPYESFLSRRILGVPNPSRIFLRALGLNSSKNLTRFTPETGSSQ